MADFKNILNYDGGTFESDPSLWNALLQVPGLYAISRTTINHNGSFGSRINPNNGDGNGFQSSPIPNGSGRFAWLMRKYNSSNSSGIKIEDAPSGLTNFISANIAISAPNIIDKSKWRLKIVMYASYTEDNGVIKDIDINLDYNGSVAQSPDNDSIALSSIPAISGGVYGGKLNAYSITGEMEFILYHNGSISSSSFESQTDKMSVYIDNIKQTGAINPLAANATLSNPNNASADNGSISLTPSGGPANSVYTYEWSNGATTQNLTGLTEGNYTVTIRIQGTGIKLTKTYNLIYEELEDLVVTGTVQNVTSVGASDGSITISVGGGSGDYSFLWSNGATTQNLTGIPGGNYSVQVDDNQTGQRGIAQFSVVEPGEVVPTIGFFEVPKMQSITFSRAQYDSDSNFFDLSLHSQQKEKFNTFGNGFCYKQKVRQSDRINIQVRSEKETINIDLINENEEIVKTVVPILKSQYVNQELEYRISITNNGAGQSRIYFNGFQTIPIKLIPGESSIKVENANTFGLNGNYLVISIEFDALQNSEYLVINKTYVSTIDLNFADGIVKFSAVDFNIYSGVIDFNTVDEGVYYLKAYLVGFEEDTAYYSEPVEVAESFFNSIKLESSNFDNAYDIDYTTQFSSLIRPDCVMFKRVPATDNTSIRNTDNSQQILRARPQRKFEIQFIMLPPYLYEKLSVFLSQDVVKIQGVEFTCVEGLSEPEYIERFGLANCTAIVEQVNWFGTFNSDDLGGLEGDEGLIIANDGFIKR